MSKLTIDTGVSTTETIKTGFDDCNANFTELYNRLGPYNGNKAANFELQLAIKSAQVNLQYEGELFYISKVVAGTLGGGNYTYTIEVNVVNAFSGAGTKICSWTEVVGSLKTGLELILVGQSSGSGRFFRIGINWGLLTAGTTYTAATYPEGALFAVATTTTVWSGTGESDGMIQEITEATTGIDGSKQLYWINSPNEYDVTLAPIADVVGKINFKITGYGASVNIKVAATETIDKTSDVYIFIENTVGLFTITFSLIPYDGGFLIISDSSIFNIQPNP